MFGFVSRWKHRQVIRKRVATNRMLGVKVGDVCPNSYCKHYLTKTATGVVTKDEFGTSTGGRTKQLVCESEKGGCGDTWLATYTDPVIRRASAYDNSKKVLIVGKGSHKRRPGDLTEPDNWAQVLMERRARGEPDR